MQAWAGQDSAPSRPTSHDALYCENGRAGCPQPAVHRRLQQRRAGDSAPYLFMFGGERGVYEESPQRGEGEPTSLPCLSFCFQRCPSGSSLNVGEKSAWLEVRATPALTPALSPRRDHPELLSRLAPLNRTGRERDRSPVAAAASPQSAAAGDRPRSGSWAAPCSFRTCSPAMNPGSWKASTILVSRIGTMNPILDPPRIRAASTSRIQGGARSGEGVAAAGSWAGGKSLSARRS
jgi:hypothetical protein